MQEAFLLFHVASGVQYAANEGPFAVRSLQTLIVVLAKRVQTPWTLAAFFRKRREARVPWRAVPKTPTRSALAFCCPHHPKPRLILNRGVILPRNVVGQMTYLFH